MADDVLLNKAAAIERAVARVLEEYGGDDANLLDFLEFTRILITR